MENRRRSTRFEFPLQIKYYSDNDSSRFSYTVAKNFSDTGVCMPAVSSIVKDGNIVNLEIISNVNDKITAKGQVKWTRPFNRPALQDEEAGIEFIHIPAAGVEKIINTFRVRQARSVAV